ncbi:probable polygalacturonase At3g15720 [Malania oleifera]|uniref:probable polygalacturonase At3g15720 n=1 Tax=Malania oleifera TaxID=397392 RepID=UPI0025AE8583|nr:probable polygalacturonase At3g15720 [Malania oleifera]
MVALLLLILCMASSCSCRRIESDHSPRKKLLQAPAAGNQVFNVMDFGAAGNGQSDDSQAFVKAWEAACGCVQGIPTVVIPAGNTFLLNPVELEGPCKSNTLLVQAFGSIVAPSSLDIWENSEKGNWIVFKEVDGLTIDGAGTGEINGHGEAWWEQCDNQNCNRPVSLRIQKCNAFKVSGLKFVNSPKGHIGLSGSSDGDLSGLAFVAPDESPNTDGIDLSNCTGIDIHDSIFTTGDDCVAINGGCSFINITNVRCGPGHGISVGSLGEDGSHETVEEVNVQNCSFIKTQNGVRIKTWQGGSGYAKKIHFHNIKLDNVKNPIIIDQYYCPIGSCKESSSAVEVSDVTFSMVTGTSASEEAINLSCSGTPGCSNIVLDQVNISPSEPSKKISSTCSNVRGRGVNVTPSVPCLS